MEGDRYTKVCDLGNEKKIIVLHFPVASQRSSEISKDPQRYPEILPGFLFLYKPLRPSIAIIAYRSSPRGEQY
jgi:hypothetical protein